MHTSQAHPITWVFEPPPCEVGYRDFTPGQLPPIHRVHRPQREDPLAHVDDATLELAVAPLGHVKFPNTLNKMLAAIDAIIHFLVICRGQKTLTQATMPDLANSKNWLSERKHPFIDHNSLNSGRAYSSLPPSCPPHALRGKYLNAPLTSTLIS